jgi:hypothetical protein
LAYGIGALRDGYPLAMPPQAAIPPRPSAGARRNWRALTAIVLNKVIESPEFNHFAARIDAVDLKNMLGQIEVNAGDNRKIGG